MTEERLIIGVQPIREAIRTRAASRVLIDARGGPRLQALTRFAGDQDIAVEQVSRARIDKLSRGGHHQGAAAFAPPLAVGSEDDVELGDGTLLVALDKITDPHNFGAVIRAAVALDATGILWGEHHAAPLTPATFRASAGAVEHAALFRVRSLRGAIEKLTARGATTIALDANAETDIGELAVDGPCVLVVGAEDTGVTRGVRRACSTAARLPMPGPIDSLNASVAAAVAIYAVQQARRS